MSFPSISQFKGLNNASDPLRLKLGWLSSADNVDVTSTEALERRKGYTRSITAPMSGAYSTRDFTRLYAVSGSSLIRVNSDMTTKTIATLMGTGRMYWAEANRLVYFNNGVDRGIIDAADEVSVWEWSVPVPPGVFAVSGALPKGTYQACFTFLLPDGRETGAGPSAGVTLDGSQAFSITGIPQITGYVTQLYITPADSTVFQLVGPVTSTSYTWNSTPDALGINLATQFMDPMPQGATVIQHWHGRMFAAQHLPSLNQTVVWFSEPLGMHLFNLNTGYFMVAGQVRMLAPTDSALIVGTDAEIMAYDDEGISQLADYGVVPGWPWVFEDKQVLIWSMRGVCRAAPFENLTQSYVSVPPGIQAGAALVLRDGEKKFMANLHAGGAAFNKRF
jgi:hypothetical protein